ILPVTIFGKQQFVRIFLRGWHFEVRPLCHVGDGSETPVIHVKTETDATMLISIVAPEQRIVPLLTKANHSETLGHFVLVFAKSQTQLRVLLRYTPQFKRVIELIDLGYF